MFPTSEYISRLTGDLKRDLSLLLPELILSLAIVAMLLMRLFSSLQRIHLAYVGIVAALTAFAVALNGWVNHEAPAPIFSGMLVIDSFGYFIRLLLLGSLTLLLWLSLLTGIPDREDSADYATLLLGGTLGMMLMTSSNNLMMAFIAVEMASLPSYALAGFLKGRKSGSEGALKYVIFGASASGVMLYGISLLAGIQGTASIPLLAHNIIHSNSELLLPTAIASLLILVGVGFKLSAVPFHFWCPDVFEGAAAEVAAFLSISSKTAALAFASRFLISVLALLDESHHHLPALAWGLLAVVTATVGNLSALTQSNIKRMLAYSTIAHAGIMMMALTSFDSRSIAPLVYYVGTYLFMNIGAFTVVALVRNKLGSEEMESYRGLLHRSPLLAVTMTLFLLSLLGLPPLAGFAGKFQVFTALFDAGKSASKTDPFLVNLYWGLLFAAAINTALSVGYYLKVVKLMTLDAPSDEKTFDIAFGARCLLSVVATFVVVLGVWWNPLSKIGEVCAASLRSSVQ